MKIGILGGTFDPIHNGHLALARAAKKQFGLDRVLIIPAFIPPHKTQRPDVSPASQRYRMVELALQGETGLEICDVEFKRKGVSYTVNTLDELKKAHPGADFFLILGADAFSEISTWREPDRIKGQTTFLVAHRPGFDKETKVIPNVHWIDMPEILISASQIRRDIRQGRRVPPGALPERVEDYARQMNLYAKDRS